jgi:hypothetical protein
MFGHNAELRAVTGLGHLALIRLVLTVACLRLIGGHPRKDVCRKRDF